MIVAISPPHARAEAPNCRPPEGAFGRFDAARPSVPVSSQPFIDGAGNERTLAQYRGKGVVLNFWATWCAPCVREMPELDRLKAAVEGDGIEVLALSEDRAGAALVEKFYRVNKIANLDVLVDVKGRVLREFGVRGLPMTVLIGPDGRERARILGAADWAAPDIVFFVKECLKP